MTTLTDTIKAENFIGELSSILNKYSIDNELNIPDFILAQFIFNFLFNQKVMHDQYEQWKGQE